MCHVILSDGRRLGSVEIIPFRMPPHRDRARDVQSLRRQHAVIAHIIRMNDAEQRCYRDFDKVLLPGIRVLDYSALRDFKLPPLSKIMNYIHLNDVGLNGLSRQTVANTLRDWGLRLPATPRRGVI